MCVCVRERESVCVSVLEELSKEKRVGKKRVLGRVVWVCVY